MVPDLVQGLAYHIPRLELAAACAAFGLPKSGTREALARRAADWVNAAPRLDRRQQRVERFLLRLPLDTLRQLAGYLLERPRGRAKPALARALAERFVPEPEEALKALHFEVIALAGEGAFGSVYKVRRPHHGGKLWAAKVVASDARTHAQEAANLARLSHPNILRYFNDFPDLVPVLVTEWCGGGILKQRLGGDEIHKTFAVAYVAKKVCNALAYLHKNGVFHCDLHPGNVLFRENGELVVADFGLSRRRGARPRIQHSKAPDGARDIFMLGRMLVSMRKGRVDAWSRSDVPFHKAFRRFWGLVRAALDPDRNKRPTAADFAAVIEADFTPQQLRKGRERLIHRADRLTRRSTNLFPQTNGLQTTAPSPFQGNIRNDCRRDWTRCDHNRNCVDI